MSETVKLSVGEWVDEYIKEGETIDIPRLRALYAEHVWRSQPSKDPLPRELEWRNAKLHGIGPWLWIKDDFWAWEICSKEFEALKSAIVKHVVRKRAIVCAGGCLGMYPRLWSEIFDTVYTFEPDAANFVCLTVNCPSERIIKINAALGAEPSSCGMEHIVSHNVGAHRINPSGNIPVMPLDAFRLPAVDAIQLDVNTFEESVLRGALETIRRTSPVISIEDENAGCRTLLESFCYKEVARVGSNPDIVFAYDAVE